MTLSATGVRAAFRERLASAGVLSMLVVLIPVRAGLLSPTAPSRSDGSTQVYSSSIAKDSIQNPCYENDSTLFFTEFTSHYNNGDASLEAVASGGGRARQVVAHAGNEAVNLPGSCFNSVTGRIAFAYDLVDTDNIWTSRPGALNDDAHQVTCLTNPTLHAEEPSWSPDGKWLVYEVDNDHNWKQVSIYEIPATNSCAHPVAPTLLVNGSSPVSSINQEPNWSPNGKWIVFQRETNFSAGYVNLWMIHPSGTDLTRITDDPNSDTDASWSPTSASVVYSTDYHAPTGNAGTNLFIVAAVADGTKVRLTSECFYDGAPSWSPDGKWVSFETALVRNNNDPTKTAVWRIAATARPGSPKC
jgi:TolB protein